MSLGAPLPPAGRSCDPSAGCDEIRCNELEPCDGVGGTAGADGAAGVAAAWSRGGGMLWCWSMWAASSRTRVDWGRVGSRGRGGSGGCDAGGGPVEASAGAGGWDSGRLSCSRGAVGACSVRSAACVRALEVVGWSRAVGWAAGWWAAVYGCGCGWFGLWLFGCGVSGWCARAYGVVSACRARSRACAGALGVAVRSRSGRQSGGWCSGCGCGCGRAGLRLLWCGSWCGGGAGGRRRGALRGAASVRARG